MLQGLYFLDYKTHFSLPNLGEKWGWVLQSECSLPGSLVGEGRGGAGSQEAGAGPHFSLQTFFPIFFLQNLGAFYGPVRHIVWKIQYVNLKKIILSKGSQTQQTTYYTIPFTWNNYIGKLMETESRLVVAKKNREWLFNGYEVFEVIKVFAGAGCPTL